MTEEENSALPSETETKELEDKLSRALAEIENTRKRGEKSLKDALEFGISDFVRELIGVLDSFSYALANMPVIQDDEGQKFCAAVKMVDDEMTKFFIKNKIIKIDPVGENFDPTYHQAISEQATDLPSGTIISVVRCGYKLSERLLRPALVTVSQ